MKRYIAKLTRDDEVRLHIVIPKFKCSLIISKLLRLASNIEAKFRLPLLPLLDPLLLIHWSIFAGIGISGSQQGSGWLLGDTVPTFPVQGYLCRLWEKPLPNWGPWISSQAGWLWLWAPRATQGLQTLLDPQSQKAGCCPCAGRGSPGGCCQRHHAPDLWKLRPEVKNIWQYHKTITEAGGLALGNLRIACRCIYGQQMVNGVWGYCRCAGGKGERKIKCS